MTYVDEYKYDKGRELAARLKDINDALVTEKPALFAQYAQDILKAKANGDVPLRDAAYAIAAAMFMHDLNTPLFESLTGLAGTLELPAEFVEGDPEDKWEDLVALVHEYSADSDAFK